MHTVDGFTPSFRMKAKLKFKADKALKALIGHIRALGTNPEALRAVLKQAAAETILKALYARMAAALPGWEQREHAMIEDTPMPTVLRDAFAWAEGEREMLASEIIGLFTDAGMIGHIDSEQGVGIGIGSFRDLNAIQTPSATEVLRDHATNSEMTTLWRQMEFGTGVYSQDPDGNPSDEFHDPGGSWWYGRRKGMGLRFFGVEGMKAVYDADKNYSLMYDDQSLQFEAVFARLMFAALTPKVK